MSEKNALSRWQFRQSGFDEADYAFNIQPGMFLATIDCKRWGKGKKLAFGDGRKIVDPTWPRSQYEGLANMRVGAKIRILYIPNRAGTLCVRQAILIAE